MKLIGGVLGAYNEPTETSASGIWKLSEQYVYTTKSNFPRFNPENVFDLTKLSSLQTKLNGNEFSLSQDSTAVAFTFKDDGTKMYVLGSANDKIYQYTLSTAWNVATATYDNISSANVNAQDNIMNGIQFKDDGTKVYLCGTVNSKVFQYNLTEAWNIGTLSYANIATPNIATTGNGTVYLDDFVITPNGNVVIYIGASASASPIYQRMIRHSLSESWNIATSTWNGNITATMNFEDKPYEVDLGTQLFIGNSGKNIFTLITNQITQHNLDSSWNIRDFDKGVSTVVSNNKIYYNQQIVSSSNTESSIKMPISTVLPFDGSGETDIEFKSDGTKMYVLCDIGSTALVREYDLPVAWELNSYNPWPGYKFEYAGLTYYESANASNMTVYGFYFKSDGTKLYTVDRTDAEVRQFTLQTPWKISSATYDGVSVTSSLTYPTDVYFKDDGTKMFVAGSNSSTSASTTVVRQFNLSNAWNIASATSGGTPTTLTWTANTFVAADGSSIAFKYDGTTLYVAGNNEIRQYAVANAWNTSSANLTQEATFNVVTSTVPSIRGVTSIDFNSDGTKMFLMSSNAQVLNQYTLGTAWNVATATSSGIRYSTVGLSGYESSTSGGTTSWEKPSAFRFRPDGQKFFICPWTGGTIYEIDTTP